MPKLMSAADLMVSKLGSMFHEAMASELPIIALTPPPGSERVQHRLLDEWRIGRGVRTLEEVAETVARLLSEPGELSEMREQTRARCKRFVSQRIARWLVETLGGGQNPDLIDPDREAKLYALYTNTEQYRNVSITEYKCSEGSLCDS
jgi:glycosyltransferase involved in cell wall biosynthesis